MRAMEQYSAYSSQLGIFARETVRKSAESMAPAAWWEMFGGGFPQLQSVAVKILSQSASASGCEQNWSNFSFVHSDSRNRLTTSRACKPVWLYSNMRLAERTQSLEQGPQAPAWEVFSDEECQGSDADDSSSVEDSSSDEE